MAIFDEESLFGAVPRLKAPPHEIGQILDVLSVSELRERLTALREEAARIEAHIAVKEATKHAANALFKL